MPTTIPGPAVRSMFVGDVHCADTPPGWRTETYREDVLDKLRWLMCEAEARKLDFVVFAGDMFHHRRRVSHALIADMADAFALYSGPKLIVPGNHDLKDNVLSEVGRQPLGLLGRMPNIHILLNEPYVFERDGVDVAIWPVPYKHGLTYEECRTDCPDSPAPEGTYEVLVVHYGITDRPYPYPTLVTSDPRWNPMADLVLSGHIHDDLGVHLDRNDTPCLNYGAVARGSLTEENLTRRPRVALIDYYVKGIEIAPLEIAIAKPGDEVYRVEDKVAEDLTLAEDFLAALRDTQLAVFSPEALRSELVARYYEVDRPATEAAVEALDSVTD